MGVWDCVDRYEEGYVRAWIPELESEGWRAVERALARAASPMKTQLSFEHACIALAAAVILRSSMEPSFFDQLPSRVAAWLKDNPRSRDEALIALARKATSEAYGSFEDTWAEADESDGCLTDALELEQFFGGEPDEDDTHDAPEY